MRIWFDLNWFDCELLELLWELLFALSHLRTLLCVCFARFSWTRKSGPSFGAKFNLGSESRALPNLSRLAFCGELHKPKPRRFKSNSNCSADQSTKSRSPLQIGFPVSAPFAELFRRLRDETTNHNKSRQSRSKLSRTRKQLSFRLFQLRAAENAFYLPTEVRRKKSKFAAGCCLRFADSLRCVVCRLLLEFGLLSCLAWVRLNWHANFAPVCSLRLSPSRGSFAARSLLCCLLARQFCACCILTRLVNALRVDNL